MNLKKRRPADVCFPALLVLILGCGEKTTSPSGPDLELGQVKFRMFCSPCHGNEGEGTKNGPPPLERSAWVMGPETRIIRIVLHGVRGAIAVRDRTYNLEMPGFGRILRDEDIATILSFVRARFGAPSPPISARTVSEVRAMDPDRLEYWSAEELLRDG